MRSLLSDMENPGQVDVKNMLPILALDFRKLMGLTNSSVIDQDIKPLALGIEGLKRSLDVASVRNITNKRWFK